MLPVASNTPRMIDLKYTDVTSRRKVLHVCTVLNGEVLVVVYLPCCCGSFSSPFLRSVSSICTWEVPPYSLPQNGKVRQRGKYFIAWLYGIYIGLGLANMTI